LYYYYVSLLLINNISQLHDVLIVFVGAYGSSSGYSAGSSAGGYSTSYPVSSVSGYTSYGASAYGSNPSSYDSGYAAYGSSAY